MQEEKTVSPFERKLFMHVVQRAALVFVAAASLVTASAQIYKPLSFTEYTLPNGLHVILRHDPTAPVVTVVVWYMVGSRNEDPKRTGFAHFFEHLMFEGTDSIGRGEVSKLVQQAGGELNAFTSFDQTVYHMRVPSNALPLALWIESQRMRRLKIDTIGVETQRGVVKEERKMRYENSPYGIWNIRMFEYLFAGSPYSWTPIGASQHIDSAAIAEFKQFYDTYYVPNNAILVISGDFDEPETRRMVDAYFGFQPPGPMVPKDSVVVQPLSGMIRDTIYDSKAQLPAVFVGYRAVPDGHPDSYALQMLMDILANGESSRMYRQLVDQAQVAVQSSVFPYELEKVGAAILIGIAAPGRSIDTVEKMMYAVIDTVIAHGVTEAEFAKARNIAEARFIGDKKGTYPTALALARAYAFFGNTAMVNTEMQRFYSVRREDLQRVAKKYFATPNRVVLTFIPSTGKEGN
ncbi:MAG: insulinase family protein [Chlorobi bacterium]|nr:insulinase family protein [Chlorobiota bacterium]